MMDQEQTNQVEKSHNYLDYCDSKITVAVGISRSGNAIHVLNPRKEIAMLYTILIVLLVLFLIGVLR